MRSVEPSSGIGDAAGERSMDVSPQNEGMVEVHWDALDGQQLRYNDHTWALTGDVDVRDRGEIIGVEARQVTDVRGKTATLFFGNETPPASLNPGAFGAHFDRIERRDGDYHLVVATDRRTYRYTLHRLEYG